MWPFTKKDASRDLSEVWQGELEITIQGVGTKKYVFDMDTLASDVALVSLMLSHGVGVIVNNIKKSPWKIISFDRTAKKLVVERV